jgi:hypothetical protein
LAINRHGSDDAADPITAGRDRVLRILGKIGIVCSSRRDWVWQTRCELRSLRQRRHDEARSLTAHSITAANPDRAVAAMACPAHEPGA